MASGVESAPAVAVVVVATPTGADEQSDAVATNVSDIGFINVVHSHVSFWSLSKTINVIRRSYI